MPPSDLRGAAARGGVAESAAMRLPLVLLGCALVAGSSVPELRAGEGVPGLRWSAPASCPSRGEVAARLARRSPLAARLEARVRIERVAADSLLALVELPGGERRELRASDCRSLSDAVLVVLSLSLGWAAPDGGAPGGDGGGGDGGGGDGAGAPPPGRAAALEAEPDAGGQLTVTGAASPTGRRVRPGLSVAAGGDASWGLLHDAALAPVAGVSAETRGWRLRLAGRWSRGELVEASDPPERGARFALTAGELDLCRRVVGWLWGCAGGSAGSLRASGFGVREPASDTSLWLSIDAAAELRAPLGRRVELVLGARGSAPLRRHRYGFDGDDPLHQVARVTGRIVIGVSWSVFAPGSPTAPTQPTEAAHARSDL